MAEADSQEAATTAVAGTVAGMAAMAVGTVVTVDGTEATVAGGAVIGAILATVTQGDSALALGLAGDPTGALATLMGMDTARLGLRRILHIVTLTRTVIPMCHLAM